MDGLEFHFGHGSNLVLLLLAILALCLLYFLFTKSDANLDNHPLLETESLYRRKTMTIRLNTDVLGLQKDGYNKFTKSGKIWSAWGPADELVYFVPPSVCEEIKGYETNKLFFLKAIDDSFKLSNYVNVLDRLHVNATKYSLNGSLSQMDSWLVRQTDRVMELSLGSISVDWQTVKIFPLLWDMMNGIDAALILGEAFAENQSYLTASAKFCQLVPPFGFFCNAMPNLLQKPFWWLSPFGFMIRYYVRALKGIIIPEIRKRMVALERGEKREFTMIDAILGLVEHPLNEKEIHQRAEELIFMTFEGAGPLSTTSFQLVCDMLSHPEYIMPLEEEVEHAVSSAGGWSRQALDAMPILESFLRESLRLSPPAPFTVTRRVMTPVSLSSGTTLRRGMFISAPTLAIQRDEDHYKSAEQFDGYRFYDRATNSTRLKASTTGDKFLTWGLGTQACPGRFFAVRVLKLVLAKLLSEYDLRMPEQKEKPFELSLPGQVTRNLNISVEIRRRSK